MIIVTARTTRKRGSQNLLLERSRWNSIEKDLADTYEKIVWKRNLFMMPSGETGGKVYRRNNSSFETLDSRLAVEGNST